MSDKKRARPIEYTPELADEIVNHYISGLTFKQMASLFDHLPTATTLFRWQDTYPDLRMRLVNARDLHADAIIEEAVEIADTAFDSSKARNQIEIRKWRAGKLSKLYSDKVTVDVNQTISITAALGDAKGRLERLISDQSHIIDAQAIDITEQTEARAADKISASQPSGEEDDLFW